MNQKTKIIGSIAVVMTLVLFSILTVINFVEINAVSNDITDNNTSDTNEQYFLKIYADKESGSVPHNVNFKPLLIGTNGEVEYNWDFGDGKNSNEIKPTHVYDEEGTYICKLTVKDKQNKLTDFINISVGPNNPPEVKILVSDTIVYRPISMDFDAQAYDEDGEIVSYEWLIQQPQIGPIIPEEKFNEKSFTLDTLKMWRKGEYHVTLKVTDNSGNTATDHIRITVNKGKIGSLYDFVMNQIRSVTFMYGQFGDFTNLLITIGIWYQIYNFFKDNGIDTLAQLMDWILDLLKIEPEIEPEISNYN